MRRGETSSITCERTLLSHDSSLVRAVLLALLSQLLSGAQLGPCDPELAAPAGNPYGYRLRGERCEGVYIQPVSSSALVIASFTSAFEDYDTNNGQDLKVQWDSPAPAGVRVRARTLDRRLHYRMDAMRPKTASSILLWPAGLLHSLQIRRSNLGLLAWVPSGASVIGKDLYLPARVLQKQRTPAGGSLELALLPGVELSEVYVSLAPVGQDGRTGAMIRDGEALRYGYYPADRSIVFSIPAPASTGIFYLEISASLKSGGSVTLPIWFYNPRVENRTGQPLGKQ